MSSLRMTKISIIVEDEKGKQLAKVQSRKSKLSNYRLNEIEIAVEKFKREMLPDLTRALVERGQEEFTTEKKKRMG